MGIAVADLAASERFYRTVLSALGAEPTHADAEMVDWYDWAIDRTDRAANEWDASGRLAQLLSGGLKIEVLG